MEFEFGAAVPAGIVAGVVMMAVGLMMKPMGIKMDPQRMWGAMMRLYGGSGWAAGFVVHLVVSVLVALVYALGFELVGAHSYLWLWGFLGGAIHWTIAGVVMAMMPAIRPEVGEGLPAPGMFVKNYGMPDIPGFLMSHLAYGVAVGIAYQWLT